MKWRCVSGVVVADDSSRFVHSSDGGKNTHPLEKGQKKTIKKSDNLITEPKPLEANDASGREGHLLQI